MLEEHPHNRRKNEHAKTYGQQDFPSDSHKLVETIARERATIPDVQIHEACDCEREPVDIRDAVKVAGFMYLYIWYRGTFPRYRFDQLMRVGWKVLLPVGLGVLILTAIVGVLL